MIALCFLWRHLVHMGLAGHIWNVTFNCSCGCMTCHHILKLMEGFNVGSEDVGFT
jgi:hypothetical protein